MLKTRASIFFLASAVALLTTISIVAQLTAFDRPTFPADFKNMKLPPDPVIPEGLLNLPSFRSDLNANNALVTAFKTIKLEQTGFVGDRSQNDEARNALKKALVATPSDSELWLALAVLQGQRNSGDPLFLEALKMSYFTAPNSGRLMPVRLEAVTAFEAAADPDIRDLARGDMRLMLLREPGMKDAVVAAYRRASATGKVFIEENVRLMAPNLLQMLMG